MARPSARTVVWFALLTLPAAGAAFAATGGSAKGFGRADPLESVKASIRLKNFGAAQSDLQRLADAGNAEAQYLLAAFYLNGLGGPRDPVKAKLWLEKAAAQGNSHAAFSLASLYADADPPDPQAAEHWLARARELGFTPQTRSAATAGAAADSRSFLERVSSKGATARRMPAHNLRDRQPAADAQGGRRGSVLLRIESAIHPG